MRASKQGAALRFKVIAFSMKPSQDALRPRSAPGLPISFAGPPVFQTDAELAGLLVGPTEHDVALVPAARLLQILGRVHPPAPEGDDPI